MKKMKTFTKKNRYYLLAFVACLVISVSGVFAYVGGIQADEKKYPDSVTIGNKTYTKNHKLTVLEIVPDEAYDEIGTLMGDDQGTVTWDDLVSKAPKGKSKSLELTTYITDYINPYYSFTTAMLGTNDLKICFKNKLSGEIFDTPWGIHLEESYGIWDGSQNVSKKGINYDLSNIEIVFAVKQGSDWNSTWVEPEEGMRNVFGYMIFGNTNMEDKMNLVVKKASQVTVNDINNAGLVYINGKGHDTSLQSLYNKINNKNVDSSHMAWQHSKEDLSAEVAFELYRQNVIDGKALLYGSTDKGAGSDGVYSNIARITTLKNAIDGDTFIADFAFRKESDTSYKGSRGGVKIENGLINVYVGKNKLSFSPNMFIDSTNGYVSIEDNNKAGYPVYNANVRQDYLDHFTYEFNADNSMTHSLTSGTTYKEDYTDGTYQGTSYSDAVHRLDVDSEHLTPAKNVCYILGDYAKTDISTIRVLEIEPMGVYRYNTDEYKDVIKSWFDVKDDDSVEVEVDSYSVNAFIGLNTDLASEYDLVIFGASDLDSDGKPCLKSAVYGEYKFNANMNLVYNKKQAYILNGNDLTEKAYNEILNYAKKGLPLVIDDTVYYSDTDTVADSCTNIKKLKITELTKKLNGVNGNVTHVDTTADASKQQVNRTLLYRNKPSADIAPTVNGSAIENYVQSGYNGTNISHTPMIQASNLADMHFKGSISGSGKYRVKIYVDRNCDSLFSEDYSSDKAELFYLAKDGNTARTDADGNILGEEWKSNSFDVSIPLPTSLSGYIAWKVEVMDTDTGLINSREGAFAVNPTRTDRVIQVLQIEDDDRKSTIDLKGEAFNNCFNKTKNVTGLNINVTKMKKSEFNDQDNKDDYLKKYSVLVLGLCDNYGNDHNEDEYNLSKDSVNAIKTYIDNGNSVLFTHDCMSYKKGSSGDVAGSESKLNYSTRVLKPVIGMKGGYCLTDTLIYKLTNKNPYEHVTTTGSTRNTNRVLKLNKGEITEYPYSLSQTEIGVAETHAQYFTLNLETMPDKNDVVVWYTLSDSSDYKYSNFFTYAGQDALNNYYIYSKGNVTYTSAGHSEINQENDEMRLFVNTFVRAILSGNTVPEVEYKGAIKESDTLYSVYYRQPVNSDSLLVEYSVADGDLVPGVGQLQTVFAFYDSNDNNKYDEGTDFLIGYFDGDGVLHSSKPLAKSLYSEHPYTLDLWQSLENVGAPQAIISEMKEKASNNSLSLGIYAKDTIDAEGYAVLKLVYRPLFNLN